MEYILLGILIILNICLLFYGLSCLKKAREIKLTKIGEQLELEETIKELSDEINSLQDKKGELIDEVNSKVQYVNSVYEQEKASASEKMELFKKTLSTAADVYVSNIEKDYTKKEEEYFEKIKKLNSDLDKTNDELTKLKNSMTAVIEAQRRQREIDEKISFYCLQLSDTDKADIKKLEEIKKVLSKPRVLSMLIWQTWFQKPLKTLAANVLGVATKTGIYKITNIETKECYIGQAVDIAARWNEHAKCGLGIDTPVGNKLYKAMQEYGLWNFSWEMLEECPKEQLNEKERYYIDLYSSYELGYNSTKGNK